MNIERVKRRLKRLEKQKQKLDVKYQGKEREYTFHAGFDLGYIKGKIAVLEELLDHL